MVVNMNIEQLDNKIQFAKEKNEAIEQKIKNLNLDEKKEFESRRRICRQYCETKEHYYAYIKDLEKQIDKENGYEKYFNLIFVGILIGILVTDYTKPLFGLTVTSSYFNVIVIGLLVAIFVNVKIATSVSELKNRCFHYNKTIQENDRELRFLRILQDRDSEIIVREFYKKDNFEILKESVESIELYSREKELAQLNFYFEINDTCYKSLNIK
jgi:hypothetical protein